MGRSLQERSLNQGAPQKVPVFDIVDCGPRNRFVANGKLVHNSRLIQLQNLPQGSLDDPRAAADALGIGGRDLLVDFLDVSGAGGNVMDALSSCIRPAIKAPEGRKLVVCDLASIESRVLGYLSGCHRINRLFAEGKDTYKDMATQIFAVDYDDVTAEQRKHSKPAVLGGGYGLGGPGLQGYAEGFGLNLTDDEAQSHIDAFRGAYPEIPAMWYWLVDTCTSVINGGPAEGGYGVTVSRDDNFLMLTMMSGRTIYYYQPMVLQKVPPWEQKKADEDPTYAPKTKPTISYMGKDQFSPQWRRITTHGGKLVENLVQATSRDILADALKVFESRYCAEADEGLTALAEVVAHVHDEAIVLAPEERAAEALEYLVEVFSSTPKWAPGLLLDAAGFITDRYYKG